MEFTTRLVCKCFLLILNGKASYDLVILPLHIRERKLGVDQIDSAGCMSALEHAVLARHHLLPIAPAITPLEVLVAREPFWDRASLGVVALGEEEAQQRGVSGVEQVNAQHFGPGAAVATFQLSSANSGVAVPKTSMTPPASSVTTASGGEAYRSTIRDSRSRRGVAV